MPLFSEYFFGELIYMLIAMIMKILFHILSIYQEAKQRQEEEVGYSNCFNMA